MSRGGKGETRCGVSRDVVTEDSVCVFCGVGGSCQRSRPRGQL